MKSKLKLSLLLFGFALLGSPVLQAQSKVGIRAGVTISKLDFQNSNGIGDIKSKLGADIALVSDFNLGPFISLSPEIHWMQKGAKIDDLNGTLGESARTFNYLEIPVLVKVKFGGLFAMAGPSFGYLLDGSDKDMDGKKSDIDLDFYKRGEFGGLIGGGIGLGPLKVDVRYLFGLSNIFDAPNSEVEIKNSGFGAGVSLMF